MTSNIIFNLNIGIRIGTNQSVKISSELLGTSCNRDISCLQ